MKLQRFFVSSPLGGEKRVTVDDKELLHQWKQVFRYGAGDSVVLLDNSGMEYEARFTLLSKEKAEFDVGSARAASRGAGQELWLFAALIKKDHYEWILEKGTELGVEHFVPVISERSEKKNLNMERARKIVREAAEQSGRGTLPEIDEPTELSLALEAATLPLLAFHPSGEKFVADFHITHEKLGVLVGPEGGWSEKEIEHFKEKQIPIYSLGSQILRAETAAIIVPALLLL